MKRFIITLILILWVFPAYNHAIVVTDPKTMAKEVAAFLKDVKQWKKYLKTFAELEKKYYRRFANALIAESGMNVDEIAILTENFFEPEMYARLPWLGDMYEKDIWAELLRIKGKKITDQYPALSVEGKRQRLNKNLYYRLNEIQRAFQDEQLKNYNDLVDARQATVDQHAFYKHMDRARVGRLRVFDEKISEYSRKSSSTDPDQATAQMAKIQIVNLEIMKENVIVLSQINALLREKITMRIKEKTLLLNYKIEAKLLNDRDKNKKNYLDEMRH